MAQQRVALGQAPKRLVGVEARALQQVIQLLIHGRSIKLIQALLTVGVEGQQRGEEVVVGPRKLGKALKRLLPPRPLHPNSEVVERHHLAKAFGHGPEQRLALLDAEQGIGNVKLQRALLLAPGYFLKSQRVGYGYGNEGAELFQQLHIGGGEVGRAAGGQREEAREVPANVQRHGREVRDAQALHLFIRCIRRIISQILLKRELLHPRVGHQFFEGRAGNGREMVGPGEQRRGFIGAVVVAQKQTLELHFFIENIDADEVERKNEAQLGRHNFEQLVLVADGGNGFVEVQQQRLVLVRHGRIRNSLWKAWQWNFPEISGMQFKEFLLFKENTQLAQMFGQFNTWPK